MGRGFQLTPAYAADNITFEFVNGTKDVKKDSEIYWSIIGKDWDTHQFVYYDPATNKLVPMKLEHNGTLVKNKEGYTDYFYSLSQYKSIQLPPIDSARV